MKAGLDSVYAYVCGHGEYGQNLAQRSDDDWIQRKDSERRRPAEARRPGVGALVLGMGLSLKP